jgi:hypothetical protein
MDQTVIARIPRDIQPFMHEAKANGVTFQAQIVTAMRKLFATPTTDEVADLRRRLEVEERPALRLSLLKEIAKLEGKL